MSATCAVVALVDADAGGVAAERMPPVGADDQRRVQRLAALERHRDGVFRRGATPRTSSSIMRSPDERAGALFERRDQMAVLDIVAEGIEFDFPGGEFHFRRAPQPAGVVDNAHDA